MNKQQLPSRGADQDLVKLSRQKKTRYFAIMTAILVLGGISGVVWYWQTKMGWRIYVNTEVGYEIGIPPGFGYLEGLSGLDSVTIVEKGAKRENWNRCDLAIWNGRSLDDVVVFKKKIWVQDNALISESKRVVDGILGEQFIRNDAYQCLNLDGPDVPCKSFGIVLPHNNSTFEFSCTVFYDEDYQRYMDVYERILSTLKFS